MSKKCERCGFENSDSMNFCLECGATLPAAATTAVLPNWGRETNPNTSPYSTGYQQIPPPPGSGQGAPPSVPTVQRSRGGGGGKVLLVVGGILSVGIFVFIVGAIVFVANLKGNKPAPDPVPIRNTGLTTPTPSVSLTPPDAPTPMAPTPATNNGSPMSAKFDKVWVDFDVTENNQYGMRIHVKCWAYNMKNVDSYLAVYFQKPDGTGLPVDDPAYRSQNGTLSLFKLLKPGYDTTTYDDLQVFMPYDKINLTSGKYSLKMDIDLIYKQGGLIQHLTFYDFQLTKP